MAHGLTQLVRRIEDSGCIDDAGLDELASVFIAADKALFWAVPEEWFGDDEIVIAEFGDVPVDEGDADHGTVDADEPVRPGPAHVARAVHPALRRGAAARLVARDPAGVDALIERREHVDARAAAAIMAGLLDGIDRLDAATWDRLVDDAVTSPDHGVRRAGIELVARRDGVEAAHLLAMRDPNGRIRDWAPTLLTERTTVGSAADSGQVREGAASRDDQQSLF